MYYRLNQSQLPRTLEFGKIDDEIEDQWFLQVNGRRIINKFLFLLNLIGSHNACLGIGSESWTYNEILNADIVKIDQVTYAGYLTIVFKH